MSVPSSPAPMPSSPEAAPVASGEHHPTGRRARIGPVGRWRAVLRSEVRKTTSVKLWWVLLIPIVLLSLISSLFGVLLTFLLPTVTEESPTRLMAGAGTVTSYVAILAALFGAMCAAGEFRHRTATLTFLTGARVQVLGAKVVVSAAVGAVYGLVIGVLAPLLGGAALGGQTLPGAGDLFALGLSGVLVCALWGAFGAAIGTIVRNQIGAAAVVVGYLTIGENVLSAVMQLGDSGGEDPSWIARLASFLPGNAGDVAIHQNAVSGIGDADTARQALDLLAGTAGAPPGWVSLLVLLAWTAAGVAVAVVVGGRRDVT